MRGVALLTVLAALSAAAWPAGAFAAPARGCGPAGYAYAGVASTTPVRGVAAAISALVRPRVQSGHVAAWVGVGGYGMGPGGTDEWIQLGMTARPGSAQRLYLEWKQPRGPARLVRLQPGLQVGEARRLHVRELPGRRSWWRAYVDGASVGRAVHLPGSHGRFPALATAESWDGGRPACNRFAYRFRGLAIAPAGGPVEGRGTVVLEDPGYRVEKRERATFVARSTR